MLKCMYMLIIAKISTRQVEARNIVPACLVGPTLKVAYYHIAKSGFSDTGMYRPIKYLGLMIDNILTMCTPNC